jgi:hypothetical protein
MAAGLKPITVLIPVNNVRLVKQAAAMDGQEKLSIYVRQLINRDLRSKGLLPADTDILVHEVYFTEDNTPLERVS